MKKKKAVFILLIIVLVGIFVYAAYMLANYYLQTHRSDEITKEAAQFVHIRQTPGESSDEAPGESSSGTSSAASKTPKRPKDPRLTEPGQEPEPEGIEVDFNGLKQINGDIIAWIYSPDSPISYPIVQSADNNYYLRRLLDGSWNTCGTLFLDYRCPKDFTGVNNIVYGHNMKNGSMFGSLTRYQSQSYYNDHPVMYLATPNQLYRVELFTGCTVSAEDNIYDPNAPLEQIQRMARRSNFKPNFDVDLTDPILTLSTCSYSFENARYVVMGTLVPID